MKTVALKVKFTGIVRVQVPEHLCQSDARLLARNIALARILVGADNPNPPDALAYFDYSDDCSAAARRTSREDWATARIIKEIGDGEVTIPGPKPRRSSRKKRG